MRSSDPPEIALFAPLSPKDRERVLAYAKHRTYAPGDVLVTEGESAAHLFVIASGHARVERSGSGALGRLGPGDFFGELALIEEHERTATVVAEDELTCWIIPAWEFRALLKEHPAMAVPMLNVMIARLHGREHHPH